MTRPLPGGTPRPTPPAYRLTPRGERVLRVLRGIVTAACCSMALAVLVLVVLAWVYDWK